MCRASLTKTGSGEDNVRASGLFSAKTAMKETCFLHIGTAKTGTTSIQTFLAANRSGLQRQGVIYPSAAGKQNHAALAAYAAEDGGDGGDGGEDVTQGRVSALLKAPQFRQELCLELDNELRNSDASVIVFSTEQLTSPKVTESAIGRTADLCSRYARQTKIIVYLREQIDFLVSFRGHTIKGGASRQKPFLLGPSAVRMMDYAALLKPWRKIFGHENMIVRRFVRTDFVDGDLLSDFAAQIPFDTSGFFRPEPRNESLGARELAFLRAFNQRVPRWVEGEKNPARRNLIEALTRFSDHDRRLTIPLDKAQRIASRFEASNRRVSEEYFGGKWQPLFPAPQLVSDTRVNEMFDLSVDHAMDIACRLLGDQELRLQKLNERPKGESAKKRETKTTEFAPQPSED